MTPEHQPPYSDPPHPPPPGAAPPAPQGTPPTGPPPGSRGAPALGPPSPPPAGKRSRSRLVFMGLAVMAACGACAGLFQFITVMVNRDSWEDLGQPVPPVDPVVLPTPTWQAPGLVLDDPDPVASIRHELESRVLETAVLDAPVESACDQPDYDGQQAASFTCTVTYEGLDVVFDISARPTSDFYFEWEGMPRELVVTREGILGQFWSVHGPDGFGQTDLRCDDGLPELALLPANQPLPQYCYARMESQQKTVRYGIVPGASEISAGLSFNSEFQD